MKNKPIHCVFLNSSFVENFSNISSWVRNDNILDCVSVLDTNPIYLEIVAVHQIVPDIADNLHILIPHKFVELVVFDGYEKSQIGYSSVQQENNNRNQVRQKK